MRKLNSLELVRAIAALLVVMYHTQSIFGPKVEFRPFLGLFDAGSRGVDLFFVLSGFVMTYVHRGDWDRPERLGNYLFNRFSRIYPAVWIMTGLALATYALGFGGLAKASKLTSWPIIASTVLLPQRGDALVNVTWTLKYEMFFYLVFAVMIVRRHVGAALLVAWQAAVLAVVVSGADRDLLWGGFYLRPICLEFGIGIGVAVLVMQRRSLPLLGRRPAQLGVLAAGCALFVGGMLHHAYVSVPATEFPDVLVFGGGAGLVIAALALLDLDAGLSIPGFLVRLGGASYAIYLAHFSVITLFASGLARLRVLPTTDAVPLMAAGVGVAAGLAFDRFVDKPVQRSLRRLKPALVR